MSVRFLALLFLCLLPHCWALGSEASINWPSINSSGVVLAFLQGPYLETLHPSSPSLPYSQSHDLLDWLCSTSCEVMHIWTQFSPAGSHCFRLDSFHSFFCNNHGIFSGVIPPGPHDVELACCLLLGRSCFSCYLLSHLFLKWWPFFCGIKFSSFNSFTFLLL